MSKITPLASGQITPTDTITVVLVEPEDVPSSVVVHSPAIAVGWILRAVRAAAPNPPKQLIDNAMDTYLYSVIHRSQESSGHQ